MRSSFDINYELKRAIKESLSGCVEELWNIMVTKDSLKLRGYFIITVHYRINDTIPDETQRRGIRNEATGDKALRVSLGSRTNIQLFSAQRRRSDYKPASLSAVVIFTLASLGGQPNSMIPLLAAVTVRPPTANSPSRSRLFGIFAVPHGG